MADQKITQLTDLATLDDADIVPVVDDVAGTPITKKFTFTTLKAFLKTYFDGFYSTKSLNNLASTQINTDLTFQDGADKEISIDTQGASNTAGDTLFFRGAEGNGTGDGGRLQIEAGHSGATTGANGGALDMFGGSANGLGNGNGGDVALYGGLPKGSGNQGHVKIVDLIGGGESIFETSVLTAPRTYTFPDSDGVFTLNNVAQTITNKRIQPRTNSSTTNANLTPDLSTANVYYRTTQTGTLTINAPTGTPVIGETIMIYVDSASAQTLTINSTYKAFGVAFPATTTAGKTFMMSAQYNGTDWKTLWANAI